MRAFKGVMVSMPGCAATAAFSATICIRCSIYVVDFNGVGWPTQNVLDACLDMDVVVVPRGRRHCCSESDGFSPDRPFRFSLQNGALCSG